MGRGNSSRHFDFIFWYGMESGAYRAMPEEEKAEFEEWRLKYVDGSGKFATSDWPGWSKYLPDPPWKRPSTEDTPKPRKRRVISYKTRLTVWRRDGFKCLECGRSDNLTVDHIHPVAQGGKDDPANLQTLCAPCNSSKGASVEDW